ncbi:3-oxoacyl-[acyl-carrier-protein] synthase III C-terminal domain-containing protein [Aquabacterium sp.]|uniref:3-oxoacyl-[acyl-carrier-protein] synthase III C-terminal domain-containing protein n=1 Tax=Aquabacterium sp. TaxID=1872578 RepID=UPI002BAB9998|nr:3-oxoacyl-[acyl-carrier-protein] synthase III C-terminal domain-containing protein [Aquabacterium sp.]HSW05652.1 3-oxoacyl-[acyl-carrier-protein] synthase III C-terminal domain-containing protein [Aquabacterium sp.]
MLASNPAPALLPLALLATGKALPSRCVSSAALDLQFGHAPGYVLHKSGIHQRHYASATENQAELAAAALRDAMARGGIRPGSIDLLLSTSGVPDQALPAMSCRILEPAGLAAGTPAFDVNASCLGFLAALQMAAGLLASGAYKRIAITACDLASRGIDWADPEASLIFGDGAAAVIIEAGQPGTSEQGILMQRFETHPAGKHMCQVRAGGTARNPRNGVVPQDYLFAMQGRAVFKFVAGLLDGFVQRLFSGSGRGLDDIDLIVPHQASHLSMQHLRKRLNVPLSRVMDIYASHGNQVCASIPTALHEALDSGRARRGSRVLMLGSAAGVTLGGMVLAL